jgi:hypothetical protein
VEGMRLVLEETRCHAKDPGFIEASSSVLVSSRVEQEYEGVATLSHASSRVAFVRRTARRERRRGLLFDLRAKPVALPFEGWSIAGQCMLKIVGTVMIAAGILVLFVLGSRQATRANPFKIKPDGGGNDRGDRQRDGAGRHLR